MLPEKSMQSAAPPDMERIIDSYGNAVMRICFLYLKDVQLAEDASQETFLKVFRHYDQFDGTAGEKTWIMRIAINVCKDYLRSAWNRRVNVVDVLNEIPVEEEQQFHEDDTVLREIMNLKPKYKEVILLFYYQDMKISEIARALDAPESTISVRLARARNILKSRLEGWYADGK